MPVEISVQIQMALQTPTPSSDRFVKRKKIKIRPLDFYLN